MWGSADPVTTKRTKTQVILANMGQYTVLLGVISLATTIRGRYFAIECVLSTLNPLHQDRLSVLVLGFNDS